MKCIFLKLRSRKYQKYFYCTKLKKEITVSCCRECVNKEYKSIERKITKNRSINTLKRKKENIRSINKNAQYSQKKVHKPMKKRRNAQLNVKKSTYNYVIERDKYSCRLCGSTTTLQLHHIHGRGKDKTNDVKNCIMLCCHCHLDVVHKNQKYWRPILDEIIKKGTDI